MYKRGFDPPESSPTALDSAAYSWISDKSSRDEIQSVETFSIQFRLLKSHNHLRANGSPVVKLYLTTIGIKNKGK